jgi:hypothetical protein
VPHERTRLRNPACKVRHRYRVRLHDHGCPQDTWPHFHVRCRRCPFEWWQPTLLPDMPVTMPEGMETE